ncbi:hypothetical protein Patl_0050 [Paraglaciecola sp. T6c]|uniref:hypothetical protein n=1 Tax=Pseudoalteromonas atlantica (strain T6c / ATCC BAA-1087) TaxID=3042615 RepID=UPI00005C588B|nr:hypothetical protein [Paraglaciecola sp. T6c]ABG38582.1 hypothetical protein Patl_0050 [Paraglaciecola sp. T6c]
MIRLTSRAWNNVLIISMLLLILMFNLTGNLFSGSSVKDETIDKLVPTDAMLTSIVTHDYTLERVGRGWRFLMATKESYNNDLVANKNKETSDNEIDKQILTDNVMAWQEALLEPIGEATLAGATQVNVWLAGESAPRHYLFFQVGADMLVQYPTQGAQLYKVTNKTWSELFFDNRF